VLFLACQNEKRPSDKGSASENTPESTDESRTQADLEILKVQNGKLNWTARKIGGQHSGTILIKSGTATVLDGTLITGEFLFDMASIQNSDLEGEEKRKLENQLRSADFFDVEQYPTAQFLITAVVNKAMVPKATYTITGDLKIKNITRSIDIPANISFVGDQLNATTPTFTFDRTDWRLKYRSKELGTAPDLIIDDDVSLKISFEAVRQ